MTSHSSIPIVVEQTYDVPVSDVWKAITNTDQMRHWYFDTIKDFTAEVGFETAFDVRCEGSVYRHLWKVTQVVPEQRLAYEWRYDGYAGDSEVVWELAESPDGTKLKLTHIGNETFPRDVEVFCRESCEAGWKYFLTESLKTFLDGQGS